MTSATESNIDIFRLATVMGPLAATSLAVTYDVGFFAGIGIDFFSFFTLGEHVVFALQAIPFFIPPMLTLLIWYATGRISYQRGYKRGVNAQRTCIQCEGNASILISMMIRPGFGCRVNLRISSVCQ